MKDSNNGASSATTAPSTSAGTPLTRRRCFQMRNQASLLDFWFTSNSEARSRYLELFKRLLRKEFPIYPYGTTHYDKLFFCALRKHKKEKGLNARHFLSHLSTMNIVRLYARFPQLYLRIEVASFRWSL